MSNGNDEKKQKQEEQDQQQEDIPKDVPEKEQWKYRAPYRIHEKDNGFDVKYEAKCHCGQVRYQLSREKPLGSKL